MDATHPSGSYRDALPSYGVVRDYCFSTRGDRDTSDDPSFSVSVVVSSVSMFSFRARLPLKLRNPPSLSSRVGKGAVSPSFV